MNDKAYVECAHIEMVNKIENVGNTGARCITIAAVELLHTSSVRLYSYLPSMQSACAVLYCYPWLLRLCQIIPHYLKDGAIFEGKKRVIKKMYVLVFSATFV